MFLRPRYVSAAIAATASIPENSSLQGNNKLAPIALEEGIRHHNIVNTPSSRQKAHDEWPPSSASSESNKGRRRRPGGLKICGRTIITRRGVLCICCYLAGLVLPSLFIFAWLRTIAMAKVVAASAAQEAQAHGGGPAIAGSFTVLVNTFERPRQLSEAVQHYAMCEGVESVRVAWSEPSTPPDEATSPQLFAHPTPVKVHPYPTTSINNRFIPPANLSTEAVFVVDDDIEVPCQHLLSAFQTWQRHPDTLVGFFPRSHVHRPPSREGEIGWVWEYLYFWRVLWNMEYSMVLTKAAFVHAKYLELYSGVASGADGREWKAGMVEAMAESRAYVDFHRNCEDIAMQMAVTTVSGLPPVTAFAPIVDIGLFGGISTAEGNGKWWQAPHAVKRSRCLADLHEIFCAAVDAASVALEEPPSSRCEPLIWTDLFAVSPRGERASEGSPTDGSVDSDLSRLPRWALAVRAPTLAEFVSADMLLVPGKVWRRFTGGKY